MILNFFRKKEKPTIHCKLCNASMKEDDSYRLIMNTKEGEHEIHVCEACIMFMQSLKKDLTNG